MKKKILGPDPQRTRSISRVNLILNHPHTWRLLWSLLASFSFYSTLCFIIRMIQIKQQILYKFYGDTGLQIHTYAQLGTAIQCVGECQIERIVNGDFKRLQQNCFLFPNSFLTQRNLLMDHKNIDLYHYKLYKIYHI